MQLERVLQIALPSCGGAQQKARLAHQLVACAFGERALCEPADDARVTGRKRGPGRSDEGPAGALVLAGVGPVVGEHRGVLYAHALEPLCGQPMTEQSVVFGQRVVGGFAEESLRE